MERGWIPLSKWASRGSEFPQTQLMDGILIRRSFRLNCETAGDPATDELASGKVDESMSPEAG
jgi:hypothetical protein